MGLWLVAAASLGAVALFAVTKPFETGLRTKGGSASSQGAVAPAVECSGLDPRRCSRGDMIVFRFDGCGQGAHVAAYAQRPADGQLIWFFPRADGGSPLLTTACGPQVLPEGIRASELPPGHYQVHVLLTHRALTRDEISSGAARDPVATATATLDVLP
jgi:hypothetical protein